MHESAPTSLYRDRKLNDKGKAKVKVKDEKRKIKGKGKATESEAPSVMEVDSEAQSINLGPAVKAEPISPVKMSMSLDPNEGVPPPGGWREDDAMMSDDEEQDRDQSGRRVRSFAETGGNDSDDGDDVNEAQMVDLSESEEEEEEDDLTADFTQVEGEVCLLDSVANEADSDRKDQRTNYSCSNSQTCSHDSKIPNQSMRQKKHRRQMVMQLERTLNQM